MQCNTIRMSGNGKLEGITERLSTSNSGEIDVSGYKAIVVNYMVLGSNNFETNFQFTEGEGRQNEDYHYYVGSGKDWTYIRTFTVDSAKAKFNFWVSKGWVQVFGIK